MLFKGSMSQTWEGVATWFQLCLDVCVQKWRTWVLSQLQGGEMSDNIPLKKGIKFAASLNMGKNYVELQYGYVFLPQASFKMGTFSNP